MGVYDGLTALLNAKVTGTGEQYIEFDNGIRIGCEDIGNHIDVSRYKEDEKIDGRRKVIIEIEDWEYECGDGCCYDWGTILRVNGSQLIDRFDGNVYVIEGILQMLDIDYEINYVSEDA